MKLKNKVAIVTGGGGGLGREIALALAREGAHLALVDVNWRNACGVAREVRNAGRKALPVQANVSKERQVMRAVERTLAEFGRTDILVNNAGIGFGAHPGWGPVKDLSLENWQEVVDTNLTGTFLCSRAVLATMITQGSGVIINISGMGSLAKANFGAYCASKSGVDTLTRVMAIELASSGIRVNALSPGALTATPPVLAVAHSDSGFMLRPPVIRDSIVYLASDDSVGVTGQLLSALQWNEEHGIDNAPFRMARTTPVPQASLPVRAGLE
ncbi:MAG: SDR family NAD(P)-dependent oxidoreductase [Chloroflexi bacterium]|nr:SDR family NAD(P)-dependent oxidoreductase [Chloroflexota bacterium]